jgi:hypothetical protein
MLLMISVDEARAYAHDNEADAAEMTSWIGAAESYLENAIGAHIDKTDERAKLLCKLLVCDMDDNRTTSDKESNSRRLLISSMLLQLQIAAAKAAEEASANA